ncbi:MAG: helix-turn-helix domain-containing protein [Candidatus Thiodiazotropha endolucinida]|nr:helix-turn-helix domain-containing protein [Candidatus Thiodiazotropha endolucinida]
MSPIDRLKWLAAIAGFDGIRGGAVVRIAIVLAKHCNQKTGMAHPSIQTIASMTGLSQRSVRTGLSELEEAKFLTITRSSGGASSLTNSYCLTNKKGVYSGSGVNLSTGVNCSSGVNYSSVTPKLQFQEPLNPTSPEQGIEQGKNKNGVKPSVSSCPHSDIIRIYHECLPELPRVVESRWSGSERARNLAARWKEDPRHQKIEFWEMFFQTVRRKPHWMGDNGKGWQSDLGWLVKRSNFDKVIEFGVNERYRSGLE